MVIVKSAGVSDVGMKRQANEDSFIMDDDLGLYVVADGMGGHAAGEVASRLAASTLQNYMKKVLVQNDAQELPDTNKNLSRKANQLAAGIVLANKSVFDVAATKSAYTGMGTTVSAVLFSDNSFIAANVGDSSIFLIRNNAISLESTLHTFAAEIAAKNSEETVGDEYKHMLTRAVGTKEKVVPDIVERACMKNDLIVICSDGLTDKLSETDIKEIVLGETSLKTACHELITLANDRGGEDNITVILLRIKHLYPADTVVYRAHRWISSMAGRLK
ncbi:MAG: protein phosphatase 2C domain-containing protein [Thermodesulfobacteriota bacterium]|nr:protein phosphatase 2C domain-containing protein [Thermodesulfobacteriota bacterium]